MAAEAMKRCACGELVDDAVRYHWLGVETGHYVDDPKVATAELGTVVAAAEGTEERAYGDPPHRAPAPGPRLPPPWPLEEELRWAAIEYLRTLGYTVHNMEQGHRPGPGHTRVGCGVPDTYFQGHGLSGWIEFKRWGREQSPGQVAFMEAELAAGGIYLLVYEVAQLVAWHTSLRRGLG